MLNEGFHVVSFVSQDPVYVWPKLFLFGNRECAVLIGSVTSPTRFCIYKLLLTGNTLAPGAGSAHARLRSTLVAGCELPRGGESETLVEGGGWVPGAGDSRGRRGGGGDGEDSSGQCAWTQCLMAVAADKTRGESEEKTRNTKTWGGENMQV